MRDWSNLPADTDACLRAARWAARRFRHGVAEFEDVVQDALVGLYSTRDSHAPGNVAFMSMRREVCRALMEDHQRIRPSQDVWKAWKRYDRLRKLDPSLTRDEAIDRLNLTAERADCLRSWLVVLRPWVTLADASSLAAPYRRVDPDAARVGSIAMNLPGRPGLVVRRAFGLDGAPESRRELCRRTGMARLTCARAEKKAFEQIRKLMRSPRPGVAGACVPAAKSFTPLAGSGNPAAVT